MKTMRSTRLALIAAALATLPAVQAHAVYISGYANFVGLTNGRFNTDNADIGGLGFFDNDQTMKLSDNRSNIANSTWSSAPIAYSNSWMASWTYTLPGDTGAFDRADGFTFGFQNDSRATGAYGGQGALLGYGAATGANPRAGVTPSVAVQTNLYNGRRNQINTNGAITATLNTTYATVPFVLNNGVPKNYVVTYSNGILKQVITDTGTGNVSSFTRAVDMATILGGPTAYMGFTASSGGNGADQTLTNFKFQSEVKAAPIAVTGFNSDFVVDASAPVGDVSAYVNATMDNGKKTDANGKLIGATFFARGYNGTTTTGLPMGSTFANANNPSKSYTLAPAEGNNALILDNLTGDTAVGTLNFVSPKAYKSLSILASSGNGSNSFDLNVRYADGSSEYIQSNAALDWYNNGTVALAAQQRVSSVVTGALDPATTPNAVYPALYSTDLFLANTTSSVVGLDFIWHFGTGHTAIFAVSGEASVTAIAGDYNNDGFVDAADYTVWADHFGQSGTNVPGDGNNDGVVNAADYTVWADHFGQGTPHVSAVPEPTALAFAAPAMALLARRRR